jgi:predicted RNA-binding Zn-ribbon protein involved in translation (DUF1610 family)
MPTVAERSDDSDLVMVVDADKSSGFACPDCGADVSHVIGHERGDAWTQEHFRYYNCGCYGDSAVKSDGGGGGGPAEHPLHRRRKLEALNYATNNYEAATHDTERWIGDKRADAVLEFESSHPEYGLGFAIEYQHKNEGKDLEQTETVYARNGFTTLWLWESEFDIEGRKRPEVRLFDGRVCTPFPKGLPESAHENDTDTDLVPPATNPHPGFPATLPLDWVAENTDPTVDEWRSRVDRMPQNLFRDTWWYALFRPGVEIKKNKNFQTPAIPATLPLDWVAENTNPTVEEWRSRIDELNETVFRDESWENLFDHPDNRLPHFPHPGIQATLPLDWLVENTDPTVDEWRSRIGKVPQSVFRDAPWTTLFDPGEGTVSPRKFTASSRLPETAPLDHIPTDTVVSATLPPDWLAENTDVSVAEWRSKFDRIHPRVWADEDWQNIIPGDRTDMASTGCGEHTRIRVSIPDTIPDYPPDGPTPLGCKECNWKGDHGEYDLVDKGKKSKTAVCPQCHGQMRLTHD